MEFKVLSDGKESFIISHPFPALLHEVQEKSATKAKPPAVYRTLLNVLSDPQNLVIETLVAALVKPISEIIQREFAEQSKKIYDLVSRVESLEVKS